MATAVKVKNKYLDLAERVGWTFIQAEIALGLLDWLASGFNLDLWHQVYASLGAAAAATVKVLLAQNIGKSNDGSLPDTTEVPHA